MSIPKIVPTRRFVAVGLSAVMTLGGVPALGITSLADRAYAADTAMSAEYAAAIDADSTSLVAAATDADTEAATTFTFSDAGITAAGAESGYEIDGTTLTITSAGTYRVTGSCSDGCITVKKGLSDVTIVLDNLTLAKDGDKAIKFKAGSSGAIVLVGESTLSTTNDKSVIKANAVSDDDDNLVYASDGTTTGGDLVISGDGTLNLTSDYTAVVDGEAEGCDAINCEGDLTVLSGTFNIAVTDDGMHADNTLTIGVQNAAGPTINISKAEEGLEGATVNLLAGTGTIVTNDDGVNAANKDLVSYGWQYGITVAGGTWKVVAGGDGLDSNGNLTIAGGTTEVYCTGSGNGALDYGEGAEGEIRGTFAITGGTLFAVGSDMLVTPSSGDFVLFGGAGGMGMGAGPGQMSGGFGPQAATQADGAEQVAEQADGDSAIETQVWGGGAFNGRTAGSSTVVTQGQTTTVSTSDATLLQTVASASGAYALFATDDLAADTQVTLSSGDATTTATVGSGSASGQGQQPGQPGQSGQPGQPGDGQQPPALPDGQQPPAMPDGQQPGQPGQPGDGQQFPTPPDGQQPTDEQTIPADGSQTPDGTTDTPTDDAADETASDSAGDSTDTATSDSTGASTDASDSSSTPSADQSDESSQVDQLADNPMTVSKTNKTLKAAVLAKSSKTVKAITVKKAKGTVTYTKVSGSKYLQVDESTGKITVKEGTPAGTYKIKVEVEAAGTSKYASASQKVTVKIKVK